MKIKDTGHSIQVSFDGEDYALLQKAAEAMNKTKWADPDNNPKSVFENFVICWIEDYFSEHGKMAENILDGVDTGYAESDPMHGERLNEMKEAFKLAGLLG